MEGFLLIGRISKKGEGIKKKVGIKYCGGCNPTYERLEIIQAVQLSLGDRFLFVRSDQQNLDGMLLISGCIRSCAIKNLNHSETTYFSISTEEELNLLIGWLMALDKPKDT